MCTLCATADKTRCVECLRDGTMDPPDEKTLEAVKLRVARTCFRNYDNQCLRGRNGSPKVTGTTLPLVLWSMALTPPFTSVRPNIKHNSHKAKQPQLVKSSSPEKLRIGSASPICTLESRCLQSAGQLISMVEALVSDRSVHTC